MSSLTRPLTGAELLYDLPVELALLREPETDLLNGRTARTLVKEGPLRVTVVARLHALRPGELLSLGPHVPHSLESRTGGSFLLTVVLPPAADRARPHP